MLAFQSSNTVTPHANCNCPPLVFFWPHGEAVGPSQVWVFWNNWLGMQSLSFMVQADKKTDLGHKHPVFRSTIRQTIYMYSLICEDWDLSSCRGYLHRNEADIQVEVDQWGLSMISDFHSGPKVITVETLNISCIRVGKYWFSKW